MGDDWIKKRTALTATIERDFLALGIPLPKDHEWWDDDTDTMAGRLKIWST